MIAEDQVHVDFTLSVKEVMHVVETMWLSQYARLVPILSSLKNMVATNSLDRHPAVYAQLCLEVGQVKKFISNFMIQISQRFESAALTDDTEDKLYAIYAHCKVCEGDLERYLDTHRRPPLIPEEQFRRSIELYTSAVAARPEYGKAFSGLFIVASAHQQVLLSIVYLVKAASVKDPFMTSPKILPLFAKRLTDSPSELKDVPIPARACVANVVALVVLHLSDDCSQKAKHLLKLIHQSIPAKEVIDNANPNALFPYLQWDTLLVILLQEVAPTSPDLLEVLRILIGRALSLRRLMPLAACLQFALATPSMANVVSAIRSHALTTIARPELSAEMAAASLPMDHLLPGSAGHGTSSGSHSDIAAARICEMCNIPWGSTPSRKTEIIVDGANVACRAGEGRREADVQAILSVYNYWTSRGFSVKVFVSDRHAQRKRKEAFRATATKSGIAVNLDDIFKLLPDAAIVTVPAQNYDDSYMIQYALNVDGLIVSNDMYRDWSLKAGNPTYAEGWIKVHVITYTFVDGIFLPNPDFKMPNPWPNRLDNIART